MGYGYLRRGDYRNASGAYEVAAEKLFRIKHTEFVEKCKESMVWIESKQRNPDEVVGFNKPSMDWDDLFFYPPVQALVSELPICLS